MPHFTCDHCNTVFFREASQVSKGATHVFCSNTCRWRGLRKVPLLIPCEYCQTPFKPDGSNYHRNKHNYCSLACRNAVRKIKHLIRPWDPSSTAGPYCSGFIDGDGSIAINRAQSGRIDVRIGNTNRPVLEWIKDQVGGTSVLTDRPPTKPHHSPMHDLTFEDRHAMAFLEGIAPYAVMKQDEIEMAMTYHMTPMTSAERHAFQWERRPPCTPDNPCVLRDLAPIHVWPYVAGFFDAEGWILHLPEYRRLSAGVDNTHWCVLEWISRHTGIHGTLSSKPAPKPNWSAAHRWTVLGLHAVALLSHLQPYLQVKRQDALEKTYRWLEDQFKQLSLSF